MGNSNPLMFMGVADPSGASYNHGVTLAGSGTSLTSGISYTTGVYLSGSGTLTGSGDAPSYSITVTCIG